MRWVTRYHADLGIDGARRNPRDAANRVFEVADDELRVMAASLRVNVTFPEMRLMSPELV
jgi:hypothetical protein